MPPCVSLRFGNDRLDIELQEYFDISFVNIVSAGSAASLIGQIK